MRRTALAVAAASVIAVPAAGQTTSPPGPWVVDVRAVTSAVPTDAAFYPATLTATVVPSRGFGADVGGHFYVFTIGPARVGLGANVMIVRASATSPVSPDQGSASTDSQRLILTMRVIAPQISFNFGSRDGWSYLSAGLGAAGINSQAGDASGDERDSGHRRAMNVGGGARWFLRPRLAFSVDLRAHQMAAGNGMPRVMAFAVGAGLSFR